MIYLSTYICDKFIKNKTALKCDFRLWEAIDQYINACKQEIIAQVDTWIEGQTEKIQERLKMKLMFSHPRYQQVKCANYDKRLKELKLHSDMLQHHINVSHCRFLLNLFSR